MEVSKPPKKFKETRLNKARNKRLSFLWDDFLGAVEKVINVLTDEELAATFWITIKYGTDDEENVYRSQFAETDWSKIKE